MNIFFLDFGMDLVALIWSNWGSDLGGPDDDLQGFNFFLGLSAP